MLAFYSFGASLIAQLVKNLPAMQETPVRFLGKSPGEGKGYPLQYSGLENSTDCIVHGVAESDTTEWLSHHFLLFLQPQIHANIQWSVKNALILRTYHWGTSVVAQKLRLCASNAERGLDWSLAEELKIPHAAWGSQKAKTKTYRWNPWSPPSDTSNAPHWINTYGMQNTDTPFVFKERWPMDCSPPGSSVPGILQARTLEWVAIRFSRGSSWHLEPNLHLLQLRVDFYPRVTWEALFPL